MKNNYFSIKADQPSDGFCLQKLQVSVMMTTWIKELQRIRIQIQFEKGKSMKSKVLKTVSAMALALALGVGVLAGTVQAAGGSGIATCSDHQWEYYMQWRREEINSESHFIYFRSYHKCTICRIEETEEERLDIEPHDLRAADPPLRYRCAGCGYEE